MQKIHKVIISLILAALLINVLPFKLFADSPTYTVLSNTECYNYSSSSYWKMMENGRGVNIINSSNKYVSVMVTNIPPSHSGYAVYIGNKNNGCPVNFNGTANISSVTVDGVTYYYTLNNADNSYYNDWPTFNVKSGFTVPTTAVYYTYGAGSVDPEEEPSFGALKIGFKTDIAYSGGNQDAWRLNKDTIYFDRYDTLGNDLFGYNIELQAVPFSVYDSSQQNVISKTVNDYLFDTVHVGSLGYWSPGQDYIDFTWEYITTRFSPVWWSTYGDNWSFTGWALENQWYRVGWSYRARLVDDEYNTLIDWQWIYNGTSIDGPDVNNIVNNNGLTPELVNSINNINNYNNTTNNNTYNNQTINYYDSDQQSDGSWIEALLESILGTIADLVGKILDFFKSILDGLLDLILGLFGDVDPAGSFFNWFSDLFNGISDIDLTLPEFNLPNEDLTSFNRLVQETLNIFSSNNIAFLIFIPLIILIIRAVF